MNRRKIIVISVVLVIAVAIFATIHFINWKYDEYTIHGNPKFDLALLDVDKKFKDYPPDYPPDPGKAGEATLLGIDADKDGVRDDVQRWIYARFHKTPLQMKAMRKHFERFQNKLKESWEEREDCLKHVRDFRYADECWRAAFPVSNSEPGKFGSYEETLMLQAKVMNTYERIRFYLKNDRKCSGSAFESVDARVEACDE